MPYSFGRTVLSEIQKANVKPSKGYLNALQGVTLALPFASVECDVLAIKFYSPVVLFASIAKLLQLINFIHTDF